MEVAKKGIYPELSAEMARHGEKYQELCVVLGIGKAAFSKKISGETEWKIKEIKALCNHYKKPFEILFSER